MLRNYGSMHRAMVSSRDPPTPAELDLIARLRDVATGAKALREYLEAHKQQAEAYLGVKRTITGWAADMNRPRINGRTTVGLRLGTFSTAERAAFEVDRAQARHRGQFVEKLNFPGLVRYHPRDARTEAQREDQAGLAAMHQSLLDKLAAVNVGIEGARERIEGAYKELVEMDAGSGALAGLAPPRREQLVQKEHGGEGWGLSRAVFSASVRKSWGSLQYVEALVARDIAASHIPGFALFFKAHGVAGLPQSHWLGPVRAAERRLGVARARGAGG